MPPCTEAGLWSCAAPEIGREKTYDGYVADVWSCGVTLFNMVFAADPFMRQGDDDHKLR